MIDQAKGRNGGGKGQEIAGACDIVRSACHGPAPLWFELGPGRSDSFPSARFRLNQYLQMSLKAKPKKAARQARNWTTHRYGFSRASNSTRRDREMGRESQPDQPTLSEATRRLVEQALGITTNAKKPSPAPAIRANELASKAIEKISDPAVPLEEQAHRSRRLTKGPSEFHAARIDLASKDEGEMSRHLSMTPRAIKNREAIARARIESRCFDCQTETSFTPRGKNDQWYMVRCTTIFGSKANPAGTGKLCIGCLENRTGRRLMPRDFTNCPLNNSPKWVRASRV